MAHEERRQNCKGRKKRQSRKPLRLREKSLFFIPFKYCFSVQKDLKLMKKSQEGNQNGNIILQKYKIINTSLYQKLFKFRGGTTCISWLSENSRQPGLIFFENLWPFHSFILGQCLCKMSCHKDSCSWHCVQMQVSEMTQLCLCVCILSSPSGCHTSIMGGRRKCKQLLVPTIPDYCCRCRMTVHTSCVLTWNR